MKTKVQKWGNSLALRIPRTLAEDANLRIGSTVELQLQDGELIVEPTSQPHYEREDLLTRIRRSNLHGEIAAGKPVGREAW